jgi:hypothetical protein
MISSFFKIFPFILLVLVAGLIAYFAYYNEMWEGGPDNYWHYYFSRYAYSKPEFFLHHWGKPFFIFVSAPFSQFGFYGLNLFNVLCGLASAYICYLFSNKLGFRMSWMVIIIVLFSSGYFITIQSAMTEPLFSLMLIACSYLIFSGRYTAGAIIASFLIYSRSEGLLIIPVYGIYLVLSRKWKFIPLLSTGFIIYSLIGYFSGHDFLWFFTENPYSAESPYGHGTWDHFFKRYTFINGIGHLMLLLPGICILFYHIFKNKEWDFRMEIKQNTKVFILVFIPALLFSLFHIYAWAAGKYASAGLERVFACVIPCLSVISMYTVDLLFKKNYHAMITASFV